MPASLFDPPYVAGSPTSEAAAGSVAGEFFVSSCRVYGHLVATGGATCDETEVALGLRHQTASARIRQLVLAGFVRDSGRTRPTRSGRAAIVWVSRRAK